MRYYLILLLLLPLRSQCQHAVISATKMNVLYIGLDNPVSFAVENTKCSELTLVVQNGSAKRTGECEYDVVVTKPGTSIIFIIKGTDTLYKSPYRVKNIPNPVVDGHDASYLLLDSLRAHTGLLATMRNFDFDGWFSILGFDITVMRNKKMGGKNKIYCSECFRKIENESYETIFSEKNEGAKFNDLLKVFIQNKLMPGDKVFIENIKATGPDNLVRLLSPIIFTVQ